MRKTLFLALPLLLAGCPKETGSTAAAVATDTVATNSAAPMKGPMPDSEATEASDAETPEAASADPTASAPSDMVGEWRVAGIAGFDMPKMEKIPSLTVNEDGSVNGFSGVNKFSGSLDSTKGTLFGAFAGTKMAGTPEMMAVERTMMDQLAKVTGYSVEGDDMVLSVDEKPAIKLSRSAE